MTTSGSDLARELYTQFGELQQVRRAWEPAWKDVTDYIYPRRSGWSINPNYKTVRAGDDIYDGKALEAHMLMSDGIQGKMVQGTMTWFKLRFKDRAVEDNQDAKKWLEECENHLYSLLQSTNFYDCESEAFPDATGICTSYVMVEDMDGELVFSPRHHLEMYISENKAGRVDTFYRHFSMTYRQASETFGDDLPQSMQAVAEKRCEHSVEIIHCVRPRKDWRPAPVGPDGRTMPQAATAKRWGSYYLIYSSPGQEFSSNQIVHEGGYDYFPLITWRMRKNPGEPYGRGPGMDAIYDVMMLNLAAKDLAEAGQRALMPNYLASEALRGRMRTANPGGITYWDGAQRPIFEQLPGVSGQFPVSIEVINRLTDSVRGHFHAEFFTMLNVERQRMEGPRMQMTATEVNAITAETASILGTIVARCQSEHLGPLIRLVFALENDAGRLPPLPASLQGIPETELEPDFVGPLAMAQRQFLRFQGSSEAAMAVIQVVMALAQATGNQGLATSMMLNFDWDGIVRDIAEAKGMVSKNIVGSKQVKQMQQALQQMQMQQAQQQAQLQQMQMVNPNEAPQPGSPAHRAQGGRQ